MWHSDTPSVTWCTHQSCCTLLEVVLHLVPASQPFPLSYFDSRPTLTVVVFNATTQQPPQPLYSRYYYFSDTNKNKTPMLPIRNLPSTTCPALPSTTALVTATPASSLNLLLQCHTARNVGGHILADIMFKIQRI